MVELNQYIVRYSGNGNTSGNVPITQSVETEDSSYSFTIPKDNNLLRTNYGFVGWSESPNTLEAQYQPGEIVNLSKTNPDKTLYAVWQPGLMLITNMQEMTTNICKIGTNIGETKQLIDTRKNTDGNTRTYWVTKLADGNCWMTQNLDYDDQNGVRVTSTGGVNGGPSSGNWKDDNAVRQYWDPGEKIISGSKLTAAIDGTDQHLLVGNYYSWLSATNGNDTSGGICPEGWRLPTGNSSGEFQALVSKGKSNSINYPNTNIPGYWLGGASATANGAAFFFANGNISNGSLNAAGSYGNYWSSTSNSAANAYYLTFSGTLVNPSSYNDRYRGISVRCVAR